MFSRKEFWFAVIFFVLAVITLIGLISRGYASYRITGVVIFAFLGVAFLRRAIKG